MGVGVMSCGEEPSIYSQIHLNSCHQTTTDSTLLEDGIKGLTDANHSKTLMTRALPQALVKHARSEIRKRCCLDCDDCRHWI